MVILPQRVWMTIPGETRKGAEGAETLRQKDGNPTNLWKAVKPAPKKQALRGQSFRQTDRGAQGQIPARLFAFHEQVRHNEEDYGYGNEDAAL